MTSNVPEVIPTTRDLAPVAELDTDSWTHMAASVIKLAQEISGTPFVPKGLRDSVPATAAAILYGREIGLPPMTSLQSIHVVEGRPSVSAERMRAMILSQGHELEVLEHTGAVCVMRGRRRGSDRWSPNVGWTLDMARAAGLGSKNNWQSYPRAMLLARATTDLARMVFPDVIAGFRATEELEDMGADDSPGDGFTATQEPATKVRRTRKTAGVPAGQPPALEPPRGRPEAPPGPPLPGEPGFEETSAGADQAPSAPESAGSVAPAPAAPDLEEGQPVTGPDQPGPVSGEDIEADPSSGAVDPAPVESGEDAPVSTPEDAASPEHGPRPASRAQQRMLLAMLGGFGVDTGDRAERLLITGTLVGRPLSSYDDLAAHDAHQLIETLGPLEADRVKLDAILDNLPPMPPVDPS